MYVYVCVCLYRWGCILKQALNTPVLPYLHDILEKNFMLLLTHSVVILLRGLSAYYFRNENIC